MLVLGLLVGFLAAALVQVPPQGASAQPVSVCEVLRELPKYQSKTIEVRGEWTGTTLRSDCGPMVLRTDYYVWPHGIAVTFPDNLIPSVDTTAPESETAGSVYRLALKGAKAELESLVPLPARNRAKIVATITGRLDVRFDEKRPNTLALVGSQPYGYGHNNLLPAQLVIASLRDAAVMIDGKSLEEWQLSGGIPNH